MKQSIAAEGLSVTFCQSANIQTCRLPEADLDGAGVNGLELD